MTADDRFLRRAATLGFEPEAEFRIGGHYVPVLRDGARVYVSGQLPRLGETVVVTGRVGERVNLDEARRGAQISAIRALALLRRELGSLVAVRQLLRVNVYVQSGASFTAHSEVADAASDLFCDILGEAGRHTRTSVGVFQLPKDASVEIDLIAAIAS